MPFVARLIRPSCWQLESVAQTVFDVTTFDVATTDHRPASSAVTREGSIAERIPRGTSRELAALWCACATSAVQPERCVTVGAVPLVEKRRAQVHEAVDEQAHDHDYRNQDECCDGGRSARDLHVTTLFMFGDVPTD